MRPILLIYMNYFLENIFDFSITNLYLPICLGVVWCDDAMVYSILLQQCPEGCIIQVSTTVVDDGPRTSVSGNDASRNKFQHLLMVLCPSGDHLDPLR